MPSFRYAALDSAGRRQTGSMSADDPRSVARRLKAMGFYPTEVEEAAGDSPLARVEARRPLFSRISHTDLTTFSRQLSDLVNAGLPMMRCFTALVEHTENSALREVLTDVRKELSGGRSLADALERHPHVFPRIYTSMVRAGEASGQLPAILRRLADFMEKERARRSQIVSSLTYPALLVTVGSVAVSLLLTFLVPRFVEIFEDIGQTLPLATRILIGVSGFMANYWWAVFGGVAAVAFLYRGWSSTPSGRYIVDRAKLRNRVFGRLVSKMVVSRFARTMATLLHGGVGVLEAFSVVRDTVGSEVVGRALDGVRERVREGASIAEPLRDTGIFPPVVTHMVALGEETGDLEGVLNSVADSYDLDIEHSIRALMALLEPVIIFMLGGVVFFVIASMLLPIFEMNLSL